MKLYSTTTVVTSTPINGGFILQSVEQVEDPYWKSIEEENDFQKRFERIEHE